MGEHCPNPRVVGGEVEKEGKRQGRIIPAGERNKNPRRKGAVGGEVVKYLRWKKGGAEKRVSAWGELNDGREAAAAEGCSIIVRTCRP